MPTNIYDSRITGNSTTYTRSVNKQVTTDTTTNDDLEPKIYNSSPLPGKSSAAIEVKKTFSQNIIDRQFRSVRSKKRSRNLIKSAQHVYDR
ncbi:hypothetical protein GJ496_008395 [Pomphorhynchus laevis]|nr:hypothetical protein GJ496_008395 [Pomphorhynchus laevis]